MIKPGVYTNESILEQIELHHKKFPSIANELQYKASKSRDLNLLRAKLNDLATHAQTTRFKLSSEDIVIAGGSLVDLHLGREPKDYDVFINIPSRVFNVVKNYLHYNPTKINLVASAEEYCKKHNIDFANDPSQQAYNNIWIKPNHSSVILTESMHVAALIWISGLIANRFFGEQKNPVLPSREKLYDDDGLMVESHIEGISKPIQLCFNVNRQDPLQSFDLECCRIGLTLDGRIFGDGCTRHFVQFNGMPTVKITERVVKYICKGVPPNANQILLMLKQYGVKSPVESDDKLRSVYFLYGAMTGKAPNLTIENFYSGGAIALMEWISGQKDETLYGQTIPTEIVRYREFKKMLDNVPLTKAIVEIRKDGLKHEDLFPF